MNKKLETIKNKIVDISQNYIEIIVDKILEDGLLKDIPLVNTMVSIYEIPHTISDALLFSKIEKFLLELENVSEKEKRKIVEKLDKEPKHKQKIGKYIIEIFNKIDDEHKAVLIAEVFKAYGKNKIDYEMFYRLNKLIQEIAVIDIEKIKFIKNGIPSSDLSIVFANLGLVKITSTFDTALYEKTKLCKTFLELELDKKYEELKINGADERT